MYRTAANRLLRFRVLRSGITSHGFPLPPTLKRSLIKPSIHLILPRRHLRRTGTIRVTEEGIQKPITRRSKLECCKPHYDMSYVHGFFFFWYFMIVLNLQIKIRLFVNSDKVRMEWGSDGSWCKGNCGFAHNCGIFPK